MSANGLKKLFGIWMLSGGCGNETEIPLARMQSGGQVLVYTVGGIALIIRELAVMLLSLIARHMTRLVPRAWLRCQAR